MSTPVKRLIKSVSEGVIVSRMLKAFSVKDLVEDVDATQRDTIKFEDCKFPCVLWVDNVKGFIYSSQEYTFKDNNIVVLHYMKYVGYGYLTFLQDGVISSIYLPDTQTAYKVDKETYDKYMESYNKLPIHIKLHNMNIFTGSDPEIFIEDNKGNVIPAFHFLPDKANAIKSSHYESLYWDGFQAEFNTNAGYCLDSHAGSVFRCLRKLSQCAKAHNPSAKLSLKSVMDISNELLETSAPEHVALGCSPSLNAYGLESMQVDPRSLPFRPAGGHIHIGFKTDKETYIKAVKAMDAIVGVACVSLFAGIDNPVRRTLYGLPGEYRLPPHGLEYRTLSNAWLCHPVICHMVTDLARKSFIFGIHDLMDKWKTPEAEVIRIIRECDVQAARDSILLNKEVFMEILESVYRKGDKGHNKVVFNVYMKGATSILKDVNNIESNWNLDGSRMPVGLNWRSNYPEIAAKKLIA